MSNLKVSKIIYKHYQNFLKEQIHGVSIEDLDENNVFEWKLILIGPKDSFYENGIFNCKIKFPNNFPLEPPKFIFNTRIYHPNIYSNGEVCISILHSPGDDKWGYEKSCERWRPVHNINSIILSILSLLSSPNDESPANIDAAIDWRNNIKLFQKKVNECVYLTL